MTTASRARLVLLSLLIAGTALAIGARLYQLQVHGNEEFRHRAANQHEAEFVVQARRGAILDRHGRELAISLETQSLYAHPWRVDDPERAAGLLAPAIGVSRRELLRRLRSDKPFVYLRRFLDAETAAAVSELDLPVGGDEAFGFEAEPRRHYPRGKLGVHVVGYATIDGDGVEGLEERFDDLLQGDPSVYMARRDARSGAVRQLVRAPERDSRDLVVTLDLVLQHIVERELDRAMRETGARAASALLLDPGDGQVLALANRPAADPNDYGKARPEQRRNRAVVDFYEPGSTFKIVAMSTALERGTIRLDGGIFCENGLLQTGRRAIRDTSPQGWLTPRQVIARSSNIGIVKVARTFPSALFLEAIESFGFGSKTGIELPGESAGFLRPLDQWSSFSRDSLAFGQEIGVTALQMAAAVGAIANDGVLVAPRVALGTRDSDGRLRRFEPPQPRRVVAPEVARELRAMLESVVRSGTGRRAAVAGYRLAGKSGTAQIATEGGYSDDEFSASFVGFGPADRPRLVGLVLLDSPDGELHQGGQVAAPIFGRIVEDALRYLRVPYDDDGAAPPLIAHADGRADESLRRRASARARRTAAGADGQVPDVLGLSLRDAVALLGEAGYRTRADGSGVVRAQKPAPGTPLSAGQTCRLRLSRKTG